MQHKTTQRPIGAYKSLFKMVKCKRHGLFFIHVQFTNSKLTLSL